MCIVFMTKNNTTKKMAVEVKYIYKRVYDSA